MNLSNWIFQAFNNDLSPTAGRVDSEYFEYYDVMKNSIYFDLIKRLNGTNRINFHTSIKLQISKELK